MILSRNCASFATDVLNDITSSYDPFDTYCSVANKAIEIELRENTKKMLRLNSRDETIEIESFVIFSFLRLTEVRIFKLIQLSFDTSCSVANKAIEIELRENTKKMLRLNSRDETIEIESFVIFSFLRLTEIITMFKLI